MKKLTHNEARLACERPADAMKHAKRHARAALRLLQRPRVHGNFWKASVELSNAAMFSEVLAAADASAKKASVFWDDQNKRWIRP